MRQAASISLKRLTLNHWAPPAFPDPERSPPHVLEADDRVAIKENLLQALLHTPPKIKYDLLAGEKYAHLNRIQVALTMKQICEHDFPEEWPNLLSNVLACLTSKDQNITYGGLLALRIIIKKYEWALS